MPEELARICILAGSSERGCCGSCGAPFRRVLQRGEPDREWQRRCGGDAEGTYEGQAQKDFAQAGAQNASDVKRRILAGMVAKRTVGWTKTCKCPYERPLPCAILDPFAGSGTTGLVAKQLGRRAILIDQSAEYVALARRRCGEGD